MWLTFISGNIITKYKSLLLPWPRSLSHPLLILFSSHPLYLSFSYISSLSLICRGGVIRERRGRREAHGQGRRATRGRGWHRPRWFFVILLDVFLAQRANVVFSFSLMFLIFLWFLMYYCTLLMCSCKYWCVCNFEWMDDRESVWLWIYIWWLWICVWICD
jgi:hypothetical protein